jgi:SSS family solute:Na+ symporter
MAEAGDKLHVCLPADHAEYPFPATMIGGYFLVTVYFWCQNQTIVQRVLGARTQWDARMGAVAACFIKLVLPFLLVLPGVIAFVLFPSLDAADKALPTLISEVIPTGLRGLIFSAVIASLMSSADSGLNSWATLFTYDIYHRLVDRAAGAKRLILVGRLASVFLMFVAVVRAPMLRGNESILQFFLGALAYISAPIIVVFMLGVFWRGATSAAAVATMISAPAVCYVVQNVRQLTGWGPQQTSIVYWLPMAVAVLIVLMLGVSLCTQPKAPAQLEGLLWRRQDTLAFGAELSVRRDIAGADRQAGAQPRIWSDHRIWAIIALLLMSALIWLFR